MCLVLQDNYSKVVDTGMRMVLTKMGISTLLSYKAAQVFEVVGIGKGVVGRFPISYAWPLLFLHRLVRTLLIRRRLSKAERNTGSFVPLSKSWTAQRQPVAATVRYWTSGEHARAQC